MERKVEIQSILGGIYVIDQEIYTWVGAVTLTYTEKMPDKT